MKKTLYNITFIVLTSVLFVYLLIDAIENEVESYSSILVGTANTGLSPIGFILLIPVLVLSIVSLCTNNKKVTFSKDVISLFSSLFILTSTIIGMCICKIVNLYVPIVIIISSIVLITMAGMAIFKAIKEDDENKKEIINDNNSEEIKQEEAE